MGALVTRLNLMGCSTRFCSRSWLLVLYIDRRIFIRWCKIQIVFLTTRTGESKSEIGPYSWTNCSSWPCSCRCFVYLLSIIWPTRLSSSRAVCHCIDKKSYLRNKFNGNLTKIIHNHITISIIHQNKVWIKNKPNNHRHNFAPT